MSHQRDLFPPAPYGGHPPFEQESETSEEAADSMEAAAPNLRGRVLARIASLGSYGSTDDETEVALELRHQTASARRRELVLMGLIEKAGVRRATRSGRSAEVYIVRNPT